MSAENDSNINAGYSLGKGEVVRSIRTGSTTYAREIAAFRKSPDPHPAVLGRTRREHVASIRGKSVDSVHDADPRRDCPWKCRADNPNCLCLKEKPMTNDNARPTKPINERFETALSELIGICLDAGMHPSEMVAHLEREADWCRGAANDPIANSPSGPFVRQRRRWLRPPAARLVENAVSQHARQARSWRGLQRRQTEEADQDGRGPHQVACWQNDA